MTIEDIKRRNHETGDPEEFRHALLCAGLDKYSEFIDLLCGLAFAAEREGVPVVD